MGRALYRKHRPKSLKEVVGQEHITQTLSEALKQGRISHAYLLTGPRGVGKTSVARILAHELNQLPYKDDSSHIDIIEIDAASNRRIDEVRELRDKVYIAPTSAKYKVYIIDEVHMLTREAFNALLKTLEEPPEHVVFILATTDAHKLPETIISRTQRFNFRPADPLKVVDLLKQIAKTEKVTVDDAALQLIAQHASGSFRDSLSLLDQAAASGKVEAASIEKMLGLPPAGSIEQLLQKITSSPAELMQALTGLYDQGYQAAAISRQLGQTLRAQLAAGSTMMPAKAVLELLDQLVEVPATHDPERSLEIALLKASPALVNEEIEVAALPAVEPQTAVEEMPVVQPKPAAKAAPEAKKANPNPGNLPFEAAIWPEVLGALKQKYNTLYGVIRMAQPDFSQPGKLSLTFAFSFHQKRLSENSNRQKLVDIIHDLTGQAIDVECIVDKTAEPPKVKIEQPPADLTAISNIFGNAELLES